MMKSYIATCDDGRPPIIFEASEGIGDALNAATEYFNVPDDCVGALPLDEAQKHESWTESIQRAQHIVIDEKSPSTEESTRENRMTETVGSSAATFQVRSPDSKIIFEITPTGAVLLGDGVTPNEASKAFWDYVMRFRIRCPNCDTKFLRATNKREEKKLYDKVCEHGRTECHECGW